MQTNQLGYSPKSLQFDEQARKKLTDGVTKMAKAVKSTLGPSGNTVLIESANHTHGITVTKDGVTVAKSIDLLDPVENLAVKMMKEAADKTSTIAGDGTTTAIVLTEAMVLKGMELITDEVNRTEVLRAMNDIVAKSVVELKKMSKKVTNNMLIDVATISANNDRVIGRIIADVYRDVGKTGIVTVENAQGAETYSEVTKGLKIARGYSSNLFINNQKKDECIFDDVMVLVADVDISNILQIENILKPIIQENKKLLIIAPCSPNVINTLAANVMKNNIKICAIQPPNFGYKQHELMQDIAISVGATYFSEKTGDDLSLMNYADLGHAARVIVGRDTTVLVKSDLKSEPEKIEERTTQLWAAHVEAKRKADKDFILERIASLTGGVGVIFVGGNTDLEQKELYDRVDDAVCAVRSALEEGILPGAGKALYEVTTCQTNTGENDNMELSIAKAIIQSALDAPIRQILANAGLSLEEIYTEKVDTFEVGTKGFSIGKTGTTHIVAGRGYNLKTGTHGDLIKMGVIDPLKVTRSALQNAVSVATTILSTNAIITMSRTYEDE